MSAIPLLQPARLMVQQPLPDLVQDKAQRRAIRNRMNAQLSRERKRKHVEELEEKVRFLEQRNRFLEQRIYELQLERASLLRSLEAFPPSGNPLDGSSSFPLPPPPPPSGEKASKRRKRKNPGPSDDAVVPLEMETSSSSSLTPFPDPAALPSFEFPALPSSPLSLPSFSSSSSSPSSSPPLPSPLSSAGASPSPSSPSSFLSSLMDDLEDSSGDDSFSFIDSLSEVLGDASSGGSSSSSSSEGESEAEDPEHLQALLSPLTNRLTSLTREMTSATSPLLRLVDDVADSPFASQPDSGAPFSLDQIQEEMGHDLGLDLDLDLDLDPQPPALQVQQQLVDQVNQLTDLTAELTQPSSLLLGQHLQQQQQQPLDDHHQGALPLQALQDLQDLQDVLDGPLQDAINSPIQALQAAAAGDDAPGGEQHLLLLPQNQEFEAGARDQAFAASDQGDLAADSAALVQQSCQASGWDDDDGGQALSNFQKIQDAGRRQLTKQAPPAPSKLLSQNLLQLLSNQPKAGQEILHQLQLRQGAGPTQDQLIQALTSFANALTKLQQVPQSQKQQRAPQFPFSPQQSQSQSYFPFSDQQKQQQQALRETALVLHSQVVHVVQFVFSVVSALAFSLFPSSGAPFPSSGAPLLPFSASPFPQAQAALVCA